MRATERETGSARKLFLATLTVAIAVLVALVIAEVFVRLTFRYNTPDTVRESSLQYIPTIFAQHRLKPGQDISTEKGWGAEGDPRMPSYRYDINEQGYRGPEITTPKGEETCRIVILGGSAVFGVKASEENNWPYLVGQYMREQGYENVEVINGGVPGHASFDSFGRLYSQIWMLEPDIVLVYNVWNDIKFLKFIDGGKTATPLLSIVRPFNSKANPFMNYRNSFDKLLSVSQIYVKLRARYYQWKLRPRFEGRIREGQHNESYGKLGLRQFRLNFELIVDAARNIGAVPVLLTQATLLRPDNTAEERERIGYEYQQMDHETLTNAFGDFNDVIRSVATEKGATYLDLDERFSGKPELFVDHVHLTERGRMEIARTVGKFLETLTSDKSQCAFTGISSAEVGSI